MMGNMRDLQREEEKEGQKLEEEINSDEKEAATEDEIPPLVCAFLILPFLQNFCKSFIALIQEDSFTELFHSFIECFIEISINSFRELLSKERSKSLIFTCHH